MLDQGAVVPRVNKAIVYVNGSLFNPRVLARVFLCSPCPFIHRCQRGSVAQAFGTLLSFYQFVKCQDWILE